MCPVCGERTDYVMNGDPDEHWETNVARLQERLIKAESTVSEIPLLEGVKVVIENDHYYLSSHEIIRSGLQHRLQYGELVQVGKQTFEVQTYSYEKRRYRVCPFSTELTDEELAVLAGP